MHFRLKYKGYSHRFKRIFYQKLTSTIDISPTMFLFSAILICLLLLLYGIIRTIYFLFELLQTERGAG
jgi:uncharacterized protein with PQ loop repeat